MSISYTWGVPQMDCFPEASGKTDVVCVVHWTLNASDGAYCAAAYGTTIMPMPPGEDFIPYADLTLDQVVGWVRGVLGDKEIDEMETALASQIATQITPLVVFPPLPWSQA